MENRRGVFAQALVAALRLRNADTVHTVKARPA